jgi:predicted nucleic acid-binding protein
MYLPQHVYVESTVWYQMANYASSEFKERTEQLFRLVEQQDYTVYISNIVLEELTFNTSKYRRRVEELLAKYQPLVLLQSAEADSLAQAYIENAYKGRTLSEIIADAYHAATAITSNITYMSSYNYRNLLNIRILEHINAINLLAGLNRHLSILPPFMFLDLECYEGEKGTVHESVWEIKTAYGKKLASLAEKSANKRAKHHEATVTKMARDLGLQVIQLAGVGS